tara:strand:+ start:162 stop:1040 length:879 start_codon:yes stop_codon:yes gene_type:complete
MTARRGFTIVELLIVIVVIAILAAITIVAYTGIQERAKDTALKSDLSNAARAIEAAKAGDPSEAYPNAFPSNVSVSNGTYLSLATETNGICINAGSTSDTTIKYSYSSSNGKIQSGTCSGEVIQGSEIGINPNLIVKQNFSGNYALNIQNYSGRSITTRNGTSTDPLPNQRVLIMSNTGTGSTSWAVVQLSVNWGQIVSGQLYNLSFYARSTGGISTGITEFGVLNGGATSTAIPIGGWAPLSNSWMRSERTVTATNNGANGHVIYLPTHVPSYTTPNWSLEFQDFQIRLAE